LGPYENMMVSRWVHVVYRHRKWYISSLGWIVMELAILDEK
jgi:hypothetical protein